MAQSIHCNRTRNDKVVTPTIEEVEKTVGADGDYTDIKTALASITDNSYYKRYTLKVQAGTYDYSDDGDDIGISLKNYITIDGVDKSKVFIKKLDSTFAMTKATVDIDKSVDIEYTSIRNCTIISNGCKCPLHIDNAKMVGTFEGINLDLINRMPDTSNVTGNERNCFASGIKSTEHFILKNVRANGVIWGHNYANTQSTGSIEFYNCTAKTIRFGELSSNGHDNIIVKGCKADIFELQWFSEYVGTKFGLYFDLEGNTINSCKIVDHAGTGDALQDYYGGKYPFTIQNLHTYCYSTENIAIGDTVYWVNNNYQFEVTKTNNGNVAGTAVENISNTMVLIEKI